MRVKHFLSENASNMVFLSCFLLAYFWISALRAIYKY